MAGRKIGVLPRPSDDLNYGQGEASKMLGWALRTLQRQRAKGQGPRYVKLSDGTILYRGVDLNQFLEDQLRGHAVTSLSRRGRPRKLAVEPAAAESLTP